MNNNYYIYIYIKYINKKMTYARINNKKYDINLQRLLINTFSAGH